MVEQPPGSTVKCNRFRDLELVRVVFLHLAPPRGRVRDRDELLLPALLSRGFRCVECGIVDWNHMVYGDLDGCYLSCVKGTAKDGFAGIISATMKGELESDT